MHKADAIGDPVSNEEIGNGGDGEVRQYLHQGIDLILLANGAEFQKGETGVHCKHHNGAQKNEQDIVGMMNLGHFHSSLAKFAANECKKRTNAVLATESTGYHSRKLHFK